MKSLWTAISVLAILNLLAVAGFGGWLAGTGRLSRERIEAIRETLAVPVALAQQEREMAEAKAKEEQTARAIEARFDGEPEAAESKLAKEREKRDLTLQQELRRASDIDAMREFLLRENDRLIKWEKELEAEHAGFLAERKRLVEASSSEQFKKVLSTLESLKSKEAHGMLAEMLSTGKREDVVLYLNSMEGRARAKVLAEFSKADPKSAADLLEGLRALGTQVSPGP